MKSRLQMGQWILSAESVAGAAEGGAAAQGSNQERRGAATGPAGSGQTQTQSGQQSAAPPVAAAPPPGACGHREETGGQGAVRIPAVNPPTRGKNWPRSAIRAHLIPNICAGKESFESSDSNNMVILPFFCDSKCIREHYRGTTLPIKRGKSTENMNAFRN